MLEFGVWETLGGKVTGVYGTSYQGEKGRLLGLDELSLQAFGHSLVMCG